MIVYGGCSCNSVEGANWQSEWDSKISSQIFSFRDDPDDKLGAKTVIFPRVVATLFFILPMYLLYR